MSSLPHYIEFLPQCKVLLCHIHGHCLTRSEIVRHLEQDHESSPEICRRASQASGELDVAVTRTGIISPAMDASPIKGLAVQEGFRCTANDNCKFLSTKLGSFQSHLSQKHGIAAWGGQSNLEFLKQNVSLQNFFPSSKPFYFCVGPGVPTSRAPTVPGSDQRRRMYEALDSRGLESEGLVDQEVGSGVGGTRRPRGQEETQGSRGSPALTLNQPFERRVPSYPNTRPTACAPSRPVRRIETVPSKPLPAGKPSFAQVLVFTERRDTAKIHLCLASDLIPIDSANATSPSPMDVDFDRYRRILVEEKIMGSGLRLEFVDTSGRKVQITNQMTFRAAVVCQAAQNVEMIAFSSEPIGKITESKADCGRLTFHPARPPPFEDSRASLPVSAPAGNFSAHTVFRTERPDTEKTHICLASDLRASVSNTINVSPMHVDFDRYCSILREVEVFDDGLSLGFIDANGKRIPIMNQMMFRAAVSYQVYQRPDMITFNAEPIGKMVNLVEDRLKCSNYLRSPPSRKASITRFTSPF